MFEVKPETLDAETSPSLLSNNLSVSKEIMVRALVFAHLEDVVVLNPKASKLCNKITLVEKAMVYQVLVCNLGGETHLVIATESGCQIWDILGEHLHYSLSLAKELTGDTGSSASKLFSLTLEPGQCKGQSEFALHTTSTIGVHSEPLHALSTPPDETRASVLVSSDDDGVIAVWSLDSSGAPEIKHKLKPTGYPVTCIQAINSTWALTERGDRLKISLAHSFRVGDDLLTGVAFSAQNLVTASYDLNHVKVWKAKA
ncbi:hypothetical protein DYB32_009419 [Aphanomyces invadans]|uniref:Uncharacterized protein n=1 Tax=Aphanomyces invadans TaxID=157072 RepID=A0A3R6VF80_9STRA|nr:hypothetical protein DYB32_009419 [Aphanomyces invadans]